MSNLPRQSDVMKSKYKVVAVALLLIGNVMAVLGAAAVAPQGPRLHTDWGQLAQNSRGVVVGEVEDISLVINGDKQISRAKPSANGQVLIELQNPADYIVGRLLRLRVKEVVKQDGNIKQGGFINVFLRGSYSAEGQPAPNKKETYLIFLATVKTAKEWRNLYVQAPDSPSRKLPFTPRFYYRIADSSDGALLVTSQTQQTIEQVKQAARQR
jgi:hypothetical protein